MPPRLRSAALSIAAIVGAGLLGTIVSLIAAGRPVPTAGFALAVVYGGLNAMFAIGLVLIYRASRIVNFSQGSLGVLGATLLLMLVLVQDWNFFLALPCAIGASAAVGFAVELLVVRPLAKAPRLALTVVTIGVGQVVIGAAILLPAFFVDPEEGLPEATQLTPLSDWTLSWSPLVFTGNHLMVVVVSIAAMVGLAAFFKYSNAGIAVRAAAENDDRASHLGINTGNLSSLVWTIAATLSGLAAVLNLTIQAAPLGPAAVGTASASILLRALAAAVIGRMENLPVVAAAAIGISIFEQSTFWAFNQTALTDLALLLLIVVVLFVQRGRLARTDEAQASTWAASEEIRAIPHELRDVSSVKAGKRRVLLAVAATILAYPWVMSPGQTSLGSVYVIYGIVIISLVVLTGWGGQLSLGQFAFVAVGAAAGSAMTVKLGWPFLVALVVAPLAGAAVAVLLGLPALRIRGLFLAVTTLAFAVATTTVFLNPRYMQWLLPDGDVARPKLLFLDTEDERVYFYLCVVALGITLWVAQGIRRSRAGRVLIAMRDNERTAQAFSINRVRTRLATFAISGYIAAFAGVLLAHQQHSVRLTAFTPEQSVQIFLLAIIGGLGSLSGALLGAVYFALVSLFIPFAAGQLFASGVGVILILLFFPGGLGAGVYMVRDAWLRRVAMRNRIFVPSLLGDYRVLDGEYTRVPLAPLSVNGDGTADGEVAVQYRIPSAIGVRGSSQQSRGWRWE